jgi:hypothetical protein
LQIWIDYRLEIVRRVTADEPTRTAYRFAEHSIRRAAEVLGLDADSGRDRKLLLAVLADILFPPYMDSPGGPLAYRRPARRGRPVKWDARRREALRGHVRAFGAHLARHDEEMQKLLAMPQDRARILLVAEWIRSNFSADYRDIDPATLARYLRGPYLREAVGNKSGPDLIPRHRTKASA